MPGGLGSFSLYTFVNNDVTQISATINGITTSVANIKGAAPLECVVTSSSTISANINGAMECVVTSSSTISANINGSAHIAATIVAASPPATILVTSEPEIKTDGNWPATTLNSGKWGFTFTPTLGSTGSPGNVWQSFLSNALGGFWLNNYDSIKLFNQLGNAGGNVLTQAISFNAADNIRIVVDIPNQTITISGALTGNGSFSFTSSGTYFATPDSLGIGKYNSGNVNELAGTMSDVDDASTGITPIIANLLGAGNVISTVAGASTIIANLLGTGTFASTTASAASISADLFGIAFISESTTGISTTS